MKIRAVGAELFSADRQTDKKKAIIAFRNFANAPKSLMFIGPCIILIVE